MFKTTFPVLLIFLLSVLTFAQNKSVYTPLTNEKCKVKFDSQIPGNMSGVCAGAGEYKLMIYDDDARMSLGVVSPDNQVSDLNLWGHFGNFSYLGEQAEWRLKNNVPVALIVRYKVSDRGDGKTPSSYLIITKISPTDSCVVGMIKPGKNQNALARQMADTAQKKPCKTIE